MTRNGNISDREISGLVCRGDSDAMKALYDRHVGYLAAICSRYVVNDEDVKDILQDSFIKIYSSIGSFDCRGEGALRGWMKKIVVNETLKFVKRAGRIDFQSLTCENIDVADDDPDVDRVPAKVIYEMIRELPDGYRTIFNLYVFENRSHREIASEFNIKESTSASQLHRAKALLASKIRQYLK